MLIVVEPRAGLCNRMRALSSGIGLSHAVGAELKVRWYLEQNMNCRFDHLFLVPPELADMRQRRAPHALRSLRNAKKKLLEKRFDAFYVQGDLRDMTDRGYDYHQLARYESVYLRADSQFYPTDRAFRWFQPLPELQAIVDGYRGAGPLVGVHIRRTDLTGSAVTSPTALFLAAMRERLAADGSTRFFLATDDPDEEAEVKGQFPGRIITHAKRSYDRGDSAAIEDALIDLYSLAGCDAVIGTQGSSFSAVAADIRGIPLLSIYAG
jgi:hypothetical protein